MIDGDNRMLGGAGVHYEVKLMRMALLGLQLSLYAVSAAAADLELPDYDIDAFCKKTATSGNGSLYERAFDNCIKNYKLHFDPLKEKWSQIDESVKIRCLKKAELYRGPKAYIALDLCVGGSSKKEQQPPESGAKP